MAMPKPTPEEKLFAVIQGAKAAPIRGKASAMSLSGFWAAFFTATGPFDLTRVNKLLSGLIVILVLFAAAPFLLQPSVENLMSTVPIRTVTPPPAALDGLKPLDAYLPTFLESDPFRIGTPQAQTAAPVDKQQEQQTYFLKRGEKLGDLNVKEIFQDRVIIQKDEQEEPLF